MKILNDDITINFDKKIQSVKYSFLDESTAFHVKAISVFDHILSEKEAENIIFFYDHAITSTDKIKVTQYFEYESNFISFYVKLFNYTSVYGVNFSENGSYCYMSFDSVEEYSSYVLMSVREKFFLKLIVPEYYVIIAGSYDLTHILYSLKSENNKFETLRDFVQNNGLYVL